jgi:hypothetical protein
MFMILVVITKFEAGVNDELAFPACLVNYFVTCDLGRSHNWNVESNDSNRKKTIKIVNLLQLGGNLSDPTSRYVRFRWRRVRLFGDAGVSPTGFRPQTRAPR